MGITRVALTVLLVGCVVLLVASAQAESHHKEHYKPDKHLLREKKAKEHHAYFHNDKQMVKQVKKQYKSNGAHHEEHMQRDAAEPHDRQTDAWHKKDGHLQVLNYEVPKDHHKQNSHSQHHAKPHHTDHHNGKHVEHHKVKESSSEHGFLHKPYKATPSTFEDKENRSPKDHSYPHNREDGHQMHLLTNKKAKAAMKDQGWSKNKKQKDKKTNHDKKPKPKQHHKKISQGELHKLW